AAVTRRYAPNGDSNQGNPEGRRLAVVLDDTLYSSPTLNEEIIGGRAQITGSFTIGECMRLVNALNSGSLPVPVEIVESRNVSATLGTDSINSGVLALLLGGAAVLIFMIIYYMLSGVIANLALALDMILLPLGMMIAAGFLALLTGATGSSSATMSLPTLTLPGIAGIVLTIGMAVDANVLIFERIREEQNAGKQFVNAVNAGYDKVFSTIFDANVTTLLVAVILFWQGSGPIRGFAVTLSAGIIVSMYTALVVTRMLYDMMGSKSSIKKLKMLTLVKNPSINFLGKRKVAAIVSLVLILGSWGLFFSKGEKNFGVDFLGGDSLMMGFNESVEKPAIQNVRDALDGAGMGGAQIQYNRPIDVGGGASEFLDVKVPFDQGSNVLATLSKVFPESDFKVLQQDSVGPQVGSELRKKGIVAIIWAMIGIVIYISFRFEFAFAIGAIVAVFHDVLITIGIYCLFGRELSLPVIAALLTIVGYSVNDTIVVFDRIREDLKLVKNKTYGQIANMSINKTLSRTLLTSITTLLTVLMLLVFGGGAINDFALALFIGILVGTYSSIFVATPVMLLWHREETDETAVAGAKAAKAKA
ncbi:MAG: protein translocase subunit SecF, partial [Verrucomicrobiota bacterium]